MKALSEDKEFISELLAQETEEDVKNLFKSRGVELTDEDIQDLKTLTMMCIKNKIELPEEILENISGGAYVKEWLGKNWDKLIYVSCVVGASVTAIISILKLAPSVQRTLRKSYDALDNLNYVALNAQEALDNINNGTISQVNNVLKKANNIADKVNNNKGWVQWLFGF